MPGASLLITKEAMSRRIRTRKFREMTSRLNRPSSLTNPKRPSSQATRTQRLNNPSKPTTRRSIKTKSLIKSLKSIVRKTSTKTRKSQGRTRAKRLRLLPREATDTTPRDM